MNLRKGGLYFEDRKIFGQKKLIIGGCLYPEEYGILFNQQKRINIIHKKKFNK